MASRKSYAFLLVVIIGALMLVLGKDRYKDIYINLVNSNSVSGGITASKQVSEPVNIPTDTSFQNVFNFDMTMKRRSTMDTDKLDPVKDWKKAFIEIAADFQVKGFEYTCKNQTWRGNWLDCNTYPFIVKKPCLIYSIGINYHFKFDDAMAEFGCEVHSFDPSMGNTTDHFRPNGVHFHPIGIGGSAIEDFTPRRDLYTVKHPKLKWKMRTIKQTMEMLGHQDRYIDILKIDIEGYEWDVVDSIMNDNLVPRIRQLDIEYHIFPDTPIDKIVRYLKIYQRFKEAGFRRYAGRLDQYNTYDRAKRIQADCEFVNLKFDFQKYPV